MSVIPLYFLTLLPFAAFFGIAVYMAIAPVYGKLSAAAFIEYFQKIDPHMKVWARALLLSELLLCAVLLVWQGRDIASAPGLLTLLALACAVASLVIAVRGNVPLNRQMDQWDPQAPPADWAAIRDRWLRFHQWRGAFEAAGFMALLVAAFLQAAAEAMG